MAKPIALTTGGGGQLAQPGSSTTGAGASGGGTSVVGSTSGFTAAPASQPPRVVWRAGRPGPVGTFRDEWPGARSPAVALG